MGKLNPDEAQLTEIALGMLSLRYDESAVILMLKLMLAFGDLEFAWDLPKIIAHKHEFPVPGGRIDLLLFHADGGVSIVEAKAANSVGMIVAGIGQLCVYASVLPTALRKARPKYIRRILCAPLEPENSLVLLAACKMAGVQLGYLTSYGSFRALIDRLPLVAA